MVRDEKVNKARGCPKWGLNGGWQGGREEAEEEGQRTAPIVLEKAKTHSGTRNRQALLGDLEFEVEVSQAVS